MHFDQSLQQRKPDPQTALGSVEGTVHLRE
jgi:hypothetical protein